MVRTGRQRSLKQLAGVALLFEALGIVGGTIALGVIWSGTGWSMERAQALGVIWIGVVLILGVLGWISVNISTPQDRVPLFAPGERRLT